MTADKNIQSELVLNTRLLCKRLVNKHIQKARKVEMRGEETD